VTAYGVRPGRPLRQTAQRAVGLVQRGLLSREPDDDGVDERERPRADDALGELDAEKDELGAMLLLAESAEHPGAFRGRHQQDLRRRGAEGAPLDGGVEAQRLDDQALVVGGIGVDEEDAPPSARWGAASVSRTRRRSLGGKVERKNAVPGAVGSAAPTLRTSAVGVSSGRMSHDTSWAASGTPAPGPSDDGPRSRSSPEGGGGPGCAARR
jgi:hypothetical protein